MNHQSERNTVAKPFAESGEIIGGQNFTIRVGRGLSPSMRLVIASALLLPGHENKDEGQDDSPPEPDGLATGVQPLSAARWWDGEMPDGFGRIAARQKPILVAWGQPLISWRKQIKIEK